MARFARRMGKIEMSGIRRIFDLAQGMNDAVDLSLGQPDFGPPPAVREAAKEAIDGGWNKYTTTQGLPAFLGALRPYAAERFGVRREDGLMATCGVAGGLFLALSALIDEGDEVLIPDPCFVLYRHVVNFLGGRPVMIDTYPDFRVRPEAIEKLATPRTKLFLFNNPVNPTGVAYAADEVAALAAVCARRGLMVLSDEIYDAFSYDFPHASFARHNAGEVVLLGGLSKSFGVPGWRLGFASGPKDVIDQMATLSQFTFVCAPVPLQMAAATALRTDMTPYVAPYRAKRDLVYEGIRERYEVVKPQGAFYIFPKVPWGDDQTFVRKAISERVLIVPGSACSSRGTHFRLSFAADDGSLRRGIDVLNRIARP